jgi:hypothetical protein
MIVFAFVSRLATIMEQPDPDFHPPATKKPGLHEETGLRLKA